uniref:Uncharacterized protein n=1 Tax=Ditylenchus dipsaci TaxID=166011 RepID=A0A915EA85_9BILA
MESDSDSDVNVFGDSSEEEVSATIRASSERIPTKVPMTQLFDSSVTTNRDIIAAALEGVIDKVRFA